MSVRAKFKVDAVNERNGTVEVMLFPVVGDSEENKKFYKYTPAGHILLATVNEAAAAQFKPGAEFYVDFIEAN